MPVPEERIILCSTSVFKKMETEAHKELGIEVSQGKLTRVFGTAVFESKYLKENHIANLTRAQYERLVAGEKAYDVIIKDDEQREECKRELYRKVFGYED